MKRLASTAALLVLMTVALFTIKPTHNVYAQQGAQWQTSDNVAWIPLGEGPGGGCGLALTTGAFAANPANSGGLSAPAVVRAQAQNNVYQVVTSAAASALTMTCDMGASAFRTTPGKGVSVTGVTVYYGNQTSALTSITGANAFSTVTLPIPGAAAAGTVAAVSGTPVFNPTLASATLTTTTSGQCNALTVTPAAPITLNTANQRLVFEMVFNQTAATATTYQICGVTVQYNNVVF